MPIPDSVPYTGIVGKQETGARRVADLLREPRPPIQWAVEGRLPAGGTGIATSAPKVGKTQAFMALTLAAARGREWLGSTVAQGPALYAIFEGSDAMNLERFERFGIRDDDDLFYAFRPAMDDPADWLLGEIERTGARLAVIDTLFRFLREGDPSDYGDATAATDKLIGMAAQTGCAIISLHHNRKSGGEGGEEILGSQSLFGSVDCHWSITRNGDRRTIGTTQRYGLDMPATEVRIDAETGWADSRRQAIGGPRRGRASGRAGRADRGGADGGGNRRAGRAVSRRVPARAVGAYGNGLCRCHRRGQTRRPAPMAGRPCLRVCVSRNPIIPVTGRVGNRKGNEMVCAICHWWRVSPETPIKDGVLDFGRCIARPPSPAIFAVADVDKWNDSTLAVVWPQTLASDHCGDSSFATWSTKRQGASRCPSCPTMKGRCNERQAKADTRPGRPTSPTWRAWSMCGR